MEHPLIGDLDHLTIDQLSERITDLNKKLIWASRNNHAMAGQIMMMLENYQSKYREKQQKNWDSLQRQGPDFGDKIDIS